MVKEVIEEWRPIEGYGDMYLISNKGRVKNKKRGTIRATHVNNFYYGYLCILLSFNGDKKLAHIHKLVAEAFIPKPKTDKRLMVYHKDKNILNNYAGNLEWRIFSYGTSLGGVRIKRRKKNNTVRGNKIVRFMGDVKSGDSVKVYLRGGRGVAGYGVVVDVVVNEVMAHYKNYEKREIAVLRECKELSLCECNFCLDEYKCKFTKN